MANIHVMVNGLDHDVDVEPRLLLIDFIRDVLGLRGTVTGCDTSSCGACTIIMDGHSAKSCTILAVQADGSDITTIEGLADGDELHPLQAAFQREHALQCGYCTPGMIMSSMSLLDDTASPTEEEVREGLKGNICRCTGYQNIVHAVRRAAAERYRE